MQTLRELIAEAAGAKKAIGHFNFSNLEGFWAIIRAAEAVGVPVILGVSEGERDFVGVRQAAALVASARTTARVPIFLNADHTYSAERLREAVDAGFDAVIFDGAKLSLDENIATTKECVAYAKASARDVLVEGELGYIGQSSTVLTDLPQGLAMTEPAEAARYVAEAGVDLFAPAVGNVHGMLGVGGDPRLDIERIRAIRQAAGVPLVLHGASGNTDEDIRAAIEVGVAIVHVNTEVRVAFRDALRLALQESPDEVAPYKITKPAVQAMQKVVEAKLKLFNNL